MKKKSESLGTVVAVGVGVAATTVAAYVLFGHDGKKNRKAIRGWMVKMKGEMIEELEKAQHVTEPIYYQIVDAVSARYAKAKDIDKKELEHAIADIRKHWKVIAKGAKLKKRR